MIMGFYLVNQVFINQFRNLEIIAWTTIIFGILLYISDKFEIEKNIEK